mmetsp:Transcript_29602/g.62910  ORF Transcript_29602/g.62910 Transcript_29602/m.62910 type:complete len:367 (-) Transcript_29602:92-1192(-)
MALAAAAIKAHFKGSGAAGGPSVGAPSAKAQAMFRASNAEVYGEDDASAGAAPAAAASAGRPDSRQSLDSQLLGIESVLAMQQAAKGPAQAQGGSGGGDDGTAMGMKEKQALLNAMFASRNSIASPAKGAPDGSSDDDDDDDSISDVSEGVAAVPPEVAEAQARERAEAEARAAEEAEDAQDPRLPSVPDQRVLAIVNSFVVNATRLINRVCVLAEKQLVDTDRGIHKLEVTLSLLEKKLKSVDGLEPHQKPTEAAAATGTGEGAGAGATQAPAAMAGEAALAATADEGGAEGSQDGEGQGASEAGAGAGGQGDLVKASDHPLYAKYFRMLRMGVVQLAVVQKMQTEGLDASVIDKGPEFLVPPTE